MKKYFSILLAASLLFIAPQAQAQTLNDIFNSIFGSGNNAQNTGNASGSKAGLSGLTNAEIVTGLKEALNVGSKNAGNKLSAVNGFFGNTLIKILLPPEAQKVENALRSVGMGSVVDKAILSMNRAAEDAAKKAAPIFINAIAGITIQDGLSILTGGQNAATEFLKARTTASLTQAFRPVIQNSLQKVNATALWNTVFSTYNKLPTTVNKINPDLTSYVTDRALNGLFVTIADEERQIRTNPAARVSSILQKVFGAK